jgi:hypothetical protein
LSIIPVCKWKKYCKTGDLVIVDECFGADPYQIPAGGFAKILPVPDIIIITGCTLVNNTIDDLITAIPQH